jgi:hypothetical protein
MACRLNYPSPCPLHWTRVCSQHCFPQYHETRVLHLHCPYAGSGPIRFKRAVTTSATIWLSIGMCADLLFDFSLSSWSECVLFNTRGNLGNLQSNPVTTGVIFKPWLRSVVPLGLLAVIHMSFIAKKYMRWCIFRFHGNLHDERRWKELLRSCKGARLRLFRGRYERC